jgi:hypothetical protein
MCIDDVYICLVDTLSKVWQDAIFFKIMNRDLLFQYRVSLRVQSADSTQVDMISSLMLVIRYSLGGWDTRLSPVAEA